MMMGRYCIECVDVIILPNPVARTFLTPLGTITNQISVSTDFNPTYAVGNMTQTQNWFTIDTSGLTNNTANMTFKAPLRINEISRMFYDEKAQSWLSEIVLYLNDSNQLPSTWLSKYAFNFILTFTSI